MNWVEILGVVATLFIVLSMSCKTLTKKSSIIMRLLNTLGSIIFIIYGLLLPALSTTILNIIVVGINIYHLILLIKHKD